MGTDGSQAEILSLPAAVAARPSLPRPFPSVSTSCKCRAKKFTKRGSGNVPSAELALKRAGLKLPTSTGLFRIRPISGLWKRSPSVWNSHGALRHQRGKIWQHFLGLYSIALNAASESGKLKPGDKILMVAFGGGLTWASVVLEW